jgi:hypothetical protein
MKRLFAFVFLVIAFGAAVTSCGGGGDEAVAVDKLTIVGAGS